MRVAGLGFDVDRQVAVLGVHDRRQHQAGRVGAGEAAVAVNRPLHRRTHAIAVAEVDVVAHADFIAVIHRRRAGHRQQQTVEQLDTTAVALHQRRETAANPQVDPRSTVGRVVTPQVITLLVGDHFQGQLIVVAQEMVTDKERDYLWNYYAADRRARINLGIRRRLAPLMERDRRRIELLNSLLLSMPGTPTLYYGDEIGMGDNIYLGDRDGVRTPMQWSIDRNGGFSRADPASLVLPPIMDPQYGYLSVNVETQAGDPHS